MIGKLRNILRAGSAVFGLSAVALVATPGLFNSLLGLQTNAGLEWSMRMTGLTLVALSGNMFSHATKGSDDSVLLTAKVMAVSAFGLGVLTLLIPAAFTWFTIAYACVGFGFSLAYTVTILRK